MKNTITTRQMMYGLKEFGGVQISLERIRQLREGYLSRKANKSGVWEKPYTPELIEGEDWSHQEMIHFTRSGVRKIFRRYGIQMTPEMWREMSAQPRTAWEARKISAA